MKREESLCWKCKNTCGGCSWTKGFVPVQGWTAKPTTLKYMDRLDSSFMVIDCPKFEAMPFSHREKTLKEIDFIYRFKRFGKLLSLEEQFITSKKLFSDDTITEIANIVNVSERTVFRILAKSREKLRHFEQLAESYREEP